jgi:arginase family enzyme
MMLTLGLTTSLGGDHTIVLPILRSLYKVYGPISVIHFDAHLDTWGRWSPQESITHGSFFYIAHEEGLLSNSSVHAGIRCKMSVRSNLVTGCNCAYILTEHILTGSRFMHRMRLICYKTKMSDSASSRLTTLTISVLMR